MSTERRGCCLRRLAQRVYAEVRADNSAPRPPAQTLDEIDALFRIERGFVKLLKHIPSLVGSSDPDIGTVPGLVQIIWDFEQDRRGAGNGRPEGHPWVRLARHVAEHGVPSVQGLGQVVDAWLAQGKRGWYYEPRSEGAGATVPPPPRPADTTHPRVRFQAMQPPEGYQYQGSPPRDPVVPQNQDQSHNPTTPAQPPSELATPTPSRPTRLSASPPATSARELPPAGASVVINVTLSSTGDGNWGHPATPFTATVAIPPEASHREQPEGSSERGSPRRRDRVASAPAMPARPSPGNGNRARSNAGSPSGSHSVAMPPNSTPPANPSRQQPQGARERVQDVSYVANDLISSTPARPAAAADETGRTAASGPRPPPSNGQQDHSTSRNNPGPQRRAVNDPFYSTATGNDDSINPTNAYGRPFGFQPSPGEREYHLRVPPPRPSSESDDGVSIATSSRYLYDPIPTEHPENVIPDFPLPTPTPTRERELEISPEDIPLPASRSNTHSPVGDHDAAAGNTGAAAAASQWQGLWHQRPGVRAQADNVSSRDMPPPEDASPTEAPARPTSQRRSPFIPPSGAATYGSEDGPGIDDAPGHIEDENEDNNAWRPQILSNHERTARVFLGNILRHTQTILESQQRMEQRLRYYERAISMQQQHRLRLPVAPSWIFNPSPFLVEGAYSREALERIAGLAPAPVGVGA
ncbi:hypothetical protein MKEN_01448000 [Mycena kentingensis (nom. inval.)]|nr:hypothetical protein MKEN_01448000 [Mycena kentingensis (nom. inval.)]